MKQILRTVIPAILFTLVLGFVVHSSFAQTLKPDIDYAGFKQEFTADNGLTRIVSVFGVNCPACRSHRDDIRDKIMAQCANPNLRWHVLWFEDKYHPATKSDAISQATYVSDNRTTQYWCPALATPKGASSYYADKIAYDFGGASWMGCGYAWDMSHLYDADATWSGTNPPQPNYCMAKVFGCCNNYSSNNFKNALEGIDVCNPDLASVNDKEDASDFVVYPNPMNYEFIINMVWEDQAYELTIIDLLGNRVFSMDDVNQGNNLITIRNIPTGTYILKLSSKEGIRKRLISIQ